MAARFSAKLSLRGSRLDRSGEAQQGRLHGGSPVLERLRARSVRPVRAGLTWIEKALVTYTVI